MNFYRISWNGDGTPFSIRAEWPKARRRGRNGPLLSTRSNDDDDDDMWAIRRILRLTRDVDNEFLS